MNLPSGAKAHGRYWPLSARLKSCPFKAAGLGGLVAGIKPCPFEAAGLGGLVAGIKSCPFKAARLGGLVAGIKPCPFKAAGLGGLVAGIKSCPFKASVREMGKTAMPAGRRGIFLDTARQGTRDSSAPLHKAE